MKLSDYRETYYYFSGKASDVARNLAFAGIAVVWIFKTTNGSVPKIPSNLILPTGLLVLTLAFDLFQYIVATTIWGFFQWNEERKLQDINDDPELSSQPCYKWPQNFFFILKLISVSLAYVYLLLFIWRAWF
jgi:hypothetical protein